MASDANRKLLANTTELTGFPPPNIADRFNNSQQWAAAASGKVRMAMVVRPEIIHPQKFGVTVALNRGLVTDTFTSEEEALAWLLQSL